MDILTTLKRHFAFLEKEFNLEPIVVPADRWDRKWTPSLGYASHATGVIITYDVRDQYLGITLHRCWSRKSRNSAVFAFLPGEQPCVSSPFTLTGIATSRSG